jgi:hypothetical protein
MTTGAKIAIGCGLALLAAGVVAVVAIGAGAWWVKGKVEETAGSLTRHSEEIDRYQKQANAHAFTMPADRVIPEARLVTFIEARKRVYAVYQAHEADFQHLKRDGKEADLSDVLKAGGIILDARLALLKALAELGMSEEEYHFIVQQVYQSAWASQVQNDTGQRPSEQMREAARMARQQIAEAMSKAEEARGRPAATEEEKKKTADALEELEKGADQVDSLDVPQENIDLFRKHEADLKKYAMEGLTIAGL